MVVGVTMRPVLAASEIAAASAEEGKGRSRWALLTPCTGRNGVDAVCGTTESCAGGFGGTRDWSCLPAPAVHLIVMALLPSLVDAFSVGSICRAWRSCFAASKRELFLALPPLLVHCGPPRCALGGFYILGERRFHRRKQPDFWPWMHCGLDGFLPTMSVIGVSHGYWIVRAVSPAWTGPSPIILMDPLSPEVRIHLPQTPHDVGRAIIAAPPDSPNCVVVLMDFERILYCRPGDTQWVRHRFVGVGDNNKASIHLEQHLVAIVGGKLYALHTSGKVVIVELFPRPTVTFLETKLLLPQHRYGSLMESNGEILHIGDVGKLNLQFPCSREHKFIVRRLDVPAREWVTLSTLGNRCLFLGGNCVTRPARCGGGEGDCIYTFCPVRRDLLLVFHMKDGRAEHHQMPLDWERHFCNWLTPSFCYL